MSPRTIRRAAFALVAVTMMGAVHADTLRVPWDYATIQAAINAAAEGDEILVSAGTYNEAINFNAKAVYLHSSEGPETTIIDATGRKATVVTCASGEGSGTVLDGFTITGGTGTPVHRRLTEGGGMRNSGSSPTVTNCMFAANSATFGGGMRNSGGSPTMIGCTFSENTAGGGGGMLNDSDSSPTVTHCTFSGNSSTDYGWGGGGGMVNWGGSPTVTHCTFSGNSACDNGGGMSNLYGSPTVTDCTFSGNFVHADTHRGSGGGMCNRESGPTVTNCTFSGNVVHHGSGGGMENSGSSATVTNCTFSANSAEFCGGLTIFDLSQVVVTNCTFSANSAEGDGGGLTIGDSSQALVTNCIVWGNSPKEVDGDTGVVAYSDVAGGHRGIGNIDADPRFVRNPDDGGDGWGDDPDTDFDESSNNDYGDLRLTVDSPCIDAGRNAHLASGSDVDGECRLMDGNADGQFFIDMGADELTGTISDCNGNGVCDTQEPAEHNCNHNSLPDECDIAYGVSLDVFPPGGDGIPDECQRVHNVTQAAYFASIQPALDAAVSGDEIIVMPGTYNEAIIFNGKAVYLHSSGGPATTIIDAAGVGGSVVTCSSGEGFGTVLDGFTITGGTGTSQEHEYAFGGGMYNSGSSPTVAHCVFSENFAGFANGGMNNEDSSPTVTNCSFSGNSGYWGGGMANDYSSPRVTDCTFSGNAGSWQGLGGGGVSNWDSSPIVTGCTFSGNSATHGEWGGMYNRGGSPSITNCILWGDALGEIYDHSGQPLVSYTNVQGGYSGTGNIDADPLFVRHPSDGGDGWGDDPDTDFDERSNNDYGDLRLQSSSPCIDTGDPTFDPPLGETDLAGLFRIWDGNADGDAIVDIGAYEFGSHAYGDLNCDGGVDFNDIDAFVAALAGREEYEQSYPACAYLLADVNADGSVDFSDIDGFVECLINRGCE